MTGASSLVRLAARMLGGMALVSAMAAMGANAQSAGDVSLFDDFDKLDWCIWDPLQADGGRLHLAREIVEGTTTSYLVNEMDGYGGPSKPLAGRCPAARPVVSDAEAEDAADAAVLGPSFVSEPPQLDERRANCPTPELEDDPAERTRAPVVQRNELRLRKHYRHDTSAGHWYAVRFRADGAIPTCGSMRSVIAQWKFNYPDDPASRHANGYSPVLALRFDNGILHATVQNGQCRCMVAKASGDPDFTVAFAEMSETGRQRLRQVSPLSCVWVGGGRSGLCLPEDRFVLEVLGDGALARIPELPDPREDWVEIKVYIETAPAPDGRPDGGRIEIYANDRPIVRASGAIGYSDAVPTTMKFKFGHYRDKILARTRLLYDRICINAGDDSACAPSRTFDDIAGGG